MPMKFYSKGWEWNGKAISDLTSDEAGDALHYLQKTKVPNHAWSSFGDRVKMLRRINYSGRGLNEKELRAEGVI